MKKYIFTLLQKYYRKEPYKLPYVYSRLQYIASRIKAKKGQPKIYDLVFVIQEESRGWILEAICKEIAKYYPGSYSFAYDIYKLPAARAYFFAHYSFLPICLKTSPHIWGSKLFPFHTHPKDIGISNDELVYAFNQSTNVVCMNSAFAQLLTNQGVKPGKATYIIAGADKELFKSHDRGKGMIGFSTAYYDRKEPDRILSIIKLLPHRKFILMGKNWEKYERYQELISLPNLKYVQVAYKDYPQHYQQMDVFVSPALLEGGPIPLVEAMMSNVFPVASATGFAPDIIRDGENGFLFNADSSAETICALIEKAHTMQKTDVRKSVEHLTWENFSKQFQRLLN